jgi:hypothetical protein
MGWIPMALGLQAAGIMGIRVLGITSRYEPRREGSAGLNRNKWILRRVGIKIARRMWTAKGTAVTRGVWRKSKVIPAMFLKKGIVILTDRILTTKREGAKNWNFSHF